MIAEEKKRDREAIGSVWGNLLRLEIFASAHGGSDRSIIEIVQLAADGHALSEGRQADLTL